MPDNSANSAFLVPGGRICKVGDVFRGALRNELRAQKHLYSAKDTGEGLLVGLEIVVRAGQRLPTPRRQALRSA